MEWICKKMGQKLETKVERTKIKDKILKNKSWRQNLKGQKLETKFEITKVETKIPKKTKFQTSKFPKLL